MFLLAIDFTGKLIFLSKPLTLKLEGGRNFQNLSYFPLETSRSAGSTDLNHCHLQQQDFRFYNSFSFGYTVLFSTEGALYFTPTKSSLARDTSHPIHLYL